MPDILAFGLAAMATSASGIPTPYDQLNQAGTIQSTFASVEYVVQIPTFSGIFSLSAQSNGSLRASWPAGSTPLVPLVYDIYIQLATATGLFVDANKVGSTFGLTVDLFSLTDGTLLDLGSTYYVGVRARDPYGNVSTSTASLFAVSLGVQPSRVLAPGDIPSIVAAVWDEIQSGHTTSGSFGRYLDLAVSTRSTQASVDAVKVDTAATLTRLGTPAGASVSADIAALKSVEDTINTKIGTPVLGTVTADIADVKVDVGAVKTDTTTTLTRLGNPVGSTFSADIANIQSTDNAINTKLGTPAGATVSADIAAVKGDTNTLTGRLTSTRATNLDNLDAAVTSRESETDAATRAATTASASSGILTAIQSIQNNTTFVGVVPADMVFPTTGTLDYKFFANLFSTAGSPKDPDGNVMYYRIDTTAGASHVATTAMTRTGVGEFEAIHTVAYNDVELELVVTFTYTDDGVSFTQRRTTRQTQSSNQLETLLDRLTPTRASNLDNLDALVSSRSIEANEVTRYNNILADGATTQAAVAAVQTKLGTPNAATVSLDIAAVRVSTDKIGSPAHTTLAGDAAAIEAKIGTPVSTLAADTAAVKSVVDTVNTKLGTPVSSVSADIASTKAVANTIDSKVGTPAVTVSDDLASVKSDTSGLRTDYTTVRAVKLDHLDADVTSRQSTATALSQYNNLTGQIGAPVSGSISSDIASVKSETDKIGTPAGSTIAVDIAAIKTVADTIDAHIGVPTTTIADELETVVNAFVVYEPHAVFSITADNKFQASMWLTINNLVQTSGIGVAAFQVYDALGATVSGLSGSGITPNGDGIFIATPVTAISLIDLTHYTIKLEITTTGPGATTVTAWRGLSIGE